MSNLPHTLIVISECKETQLNMSPTFVSGGIIKNSPNILFPPRWRGPYNQLFLN